MTGTSSVLPPNGPAENNKGPTPSTTGHLQHHKVESNEQSCFAPFEFVHDSKESQSKVVKAHHPAAKNPEELKQMDERARQLIQSSQTVRGKAAVLLSENSTPSDFQEGLKQLRELYLLNLTMNRLMKEPSLKPLKHSLREERNANYQAMLNARPHLEKVFLGNDEQIKYFVTHPDKEKEIRKQLSTMSPKDLWKWHIILRSEPENPKQCAALLKKDLIHALTEPKLDELEIVNNSLKRLTTIFPAFMGQLKTSDPQFFQLSLLLSLYLEDKAKSNHAHTIRFSDYVKEEVVPAKAKMNPEEWGKSQWIEEHSPIEYMPNDIEELEIAITTSKNTFQSLEATAASLFGKASFNSQGDIRLTREKMKLIKQIDTDSTFLVEAMKTQAHLKKLPIPKEIEKFKAYQKLSQDLLRSGKSVPPLKKGIKNSEGRYVNQEDLIVKAAKLKTFVDGITRLTKG